MYGRGKHNGAGIPRPAQPGKKRLGKFQISGPKILRAAGPIHTGQVKDKICRLAPSGKVPEVRIPVTQKKL